jgi:hypothetical protein
MMAQPKPNKTDAGNGSYGICRVIDASRSPSPDPSRSVRSEHIMQDAPEKADWISFVLHFVFGLLVGCFVGFITITRRRHGIWLQEELILPYLFGTSLFCAGLGAKLGDRLWIGDNYRIIPPDSPKHNRRSIFLSMISIVCGAGLAVVSLFLHFT